MGKFRSLDASLDFCDTMPLTVDFMCHFSVAMTKVAVNLPSKDVVWMPLPKRDWCRMLHGVTMCHVCGQTASSKSLGNGATRM